MRGLTVNVLSALFVFTFSLAFAQNVLSLRPREKANDSLGEKLTILNVQNFLKNV